jgi:hypothetical protein
MHVRALTAGLILTLATAVAAEVPRKAPEFAMQMPEGGYKLLSSYRGKVVALEFLYTTCPHCQHASVLMNQLLKEYGPQGFQPLGVAFNPMSKMLVADFVRQFGVSYPIGYSEREPVVSFLANDPNEALHVPQIVFIDKKGMIRQQSLPRGDTNTATEANMRRMIETLLKEPAGSSGSTKTTHKR